MYQNCTIAGHLGSKPTLRYTPQGQSVTTLSVATNKRWTDPQGQVRERTVWFQVSAWGKLAESCCQYLDRGRALLVEGEMQEPVSWQTKDGSLRAANAMVAKRVQFLSSPRGNAAEEEAEPEVVRNESVEEIPF
ncbi:MAG: single-stranded DNA-binding protein [Anaerolineae bacterium]